MIRQLASRIREYKRNSILAAVFVFLEVLTEVAIPFVTADLIDKGIEQGDMTYLFKIGGVLVVFTAFSLLFGILSGNHAAYASAGFAKNLRGDLFKKIQDFSFENIDKFSTATLITRLTTDVSNIQGAYQMIIRTAVRSPIMIFFATIMAFIIKPNLAIIYVFAIPFVGLGLYFIIAKVHPIFERVFGRYDGLNQIVQENIRGIRVVKSYVQEEKEIEKFTDVSDKIYKEFSLAEKIAAFNNPILQVAVYTCMLLISWFGAKLIVSKNMTTGELMSMLTYTMQIVMNLMMLSMVFVMMVISRSGAERSLEILNEESTLQNGDHPVMELNDPTITFKDVNFSYSRQAEKYALSDISVSIHPGETVGIIGATGSSKTTFVQLIPRLYDITTGSLTVGAIPVENYDLDTLRNQVAMVLQKNVLFSGTIADNLRWGNANATTADMQWAATLAQAASFIEELPDGYDSYVEQDGANFSGGQRQRLCIARALLKRPKILILDDSTSAVDTKTDAKIRQAFRDEIPDTTKIIIAQRISSVEDADKIIVMEDGSINGYGTHHELLQSNQIYQEVYESQTKEVGLHGQK